MKTRRLLAAASSAMLAAALCGCAGQGGVNQIPPLPGAPSPSAATADDTSVELLAGPATQELAVATRDAPIRIRYDAALNRYEVAAGSADWSALVDPPEFNQSGPNRYFNLAVQSGSAYFSIRAHHRSTDPDRNYRFSNLAGWRTGNSPGGEWGNIVAFGAPTPASGIPTSGSASFVGFAVGAADIANDAWGATTATPLEGTVRMNFDFAAGTLSGSLALASACDCIKPVSTGPLNFSDTAFTRGSQTFSGSFATGVDGINSFDGRFTGPRAEELIAGWSLPFLFEGAKHQAWGSWIAKRGN